MTDVTAGVVARVVARVIARVMAGVIAGVMAGGDRTGDRCGARCAPDLGAVRRRAPGGVAQLEASLIALDSAVMAR